ncbi:MAG: zf-HC2 domain-containing protein [Candidatus Aminicenantes bacterium]|nr:zf-HC2 domain-containing protein [Candidatus Aminicenantes bacterium]MDH5705459.1 zf-HC2 domain-containing protein [Candidatus Aminicenantes bacterium]
MKCKKVYRLLPLMAGGDLRSSRISAVKAHLERCPECQREYDAYILSLETTKEWLEKDRKDWEENEWQRAVQNAVTQKKPEVSTLAPLPFRKAWAYVMMGVLAVALTLLLVVRPFDIGEGMRPDSGVSSRTQARLSGGSLEESQQEVVRMTMILPETGQKIIWFFDKNFTLEVNE